MFNNFNDSDCQIIDNDITTLSLNTTIEDGEVTEDVDSRETVFEIKFNNFEQYNKLGNIVINATKSSLNKIFGDNFYTYNINTVDEEIKIEFYASAYNTKCNNSIKKTVSNVEKYLQQQTLLTDKKKDDQTPSAGNVEKKDKSPDYSGIDLLFQIDTKPATKNDINKIPSYKRSIKEVLDDEKSREEKRKKEEEACLRGVRPKTNCFNCDSNEHTLRQCPKPRNKMRINRAKKARGMRQERYHFDAEQRFSHLKPGQISDNLRKALGIRKNELPFFFYRMRKFGYPPGWLEDAKVANSGLSLFDEKSNNDVETNEDRNVTLEQEQHKYNVSKIIDFPGFNYDPGICYYDDYHYHMVPPMSKYQMKDEYIKSLGNNIIKGYKRKKLQTNLSSIAQSNSANESVEMFDMELEDEKEEDNVNIVFSRPLPPTDLINADEKPSSTTSTSTSPQQTTNPPSPSLADLEQQQLLLLNELQQNATICTDDSLIDEILELDKTPMVDLTSTTPIAIPNNNRKVTATNSIKASYEGTPILKFSPYDKLPNCEKFQEGVSDVMNFENLPDATGHYEQMKTVINRIRKTVKVLNDEE